MANLIAITYPDPETAASAMELIDWAAFDKRVDVVDACWIVNEEGEAVVYPGGHPVAAKAAIGGALGLLVGALFGLPVVGMAAGIAGGAHRGQAAERKLDDPFVESIRDQVKQGGSAIVVLYEQGTDTQGVGLDLAQLGGTVHSATFPTEELARIQRLIDQPNPAT